MQFTNESLEDMELKKFKYNRLYSKWYYGMSNEFELLSKRYFNRSQNINDCLNLWVWDKYEKNKVLDLQTVNRCHNNRFCPNCKILDISKFIHEFREFYELYSSKGYKAYMLTLTVPSCTGSELSNTISRLNDSFRKLNHKFSCDDKRSYSDRFLKFDGGVKVLEITYNKEKGFHPHFHCVVFAKQPIDSKILNKNIQGKYSNKRKDYNYKSYMDIQVGTLWSMIWHNDRLTKKNIDSMVYDPKETYYEKGKKVLEVDFRELDESGIYEVFKYTFKDSDIENYYVFKTLVQALENKRIRQGFGILFNMRCEDSDVGDVQSLDLEIEENPTFLLTREISQLTTTYREYKKISRFNVDIDSSIQNK